MAYQNRQNDGGGQRQPPKRDEQAVSTVVLKAQKEFTDIALTDNLVEWRREAQFARQMILGNYKLATADEQSIVNTMVNVANVGLSLNPIHQFAVIIPRWDKQLGNNVASLMVMYKGLMKLATDVGMDELFVENVFAEDELRVWSDDDGPHLYYERSRKAAQDTEENPYTDTVVRAKFKAYAGTFIEVVTADEMLKIRAMSDGYDENDPGCVWLKWAGEQRKKSALKRAQKRWPKTPSREWERLEKAIAIDNEVEGAKLKARAERESAEDAVIVTKFTKEQADEVLRLCKESGVSPYRLGMAYQVKTDNDGKGLEDFPSDKYKEIVERLEFAISERKKRDGDQPTDQPK